MIETSEAPRRPSVVRLARLGVGSLLALVVWAALVWTAIRVGQPPHSTGRWIVLGVSVLAAVIALFAALLLAVRFVGELRSPAPPRYQGRRVRR